MARRYGLSHAPTPDGQRRCGYRHDDRRHTLHPAMLHHLAIDALPIGRK
jgi:hypothetical protein